MTAKSTNTRHPSAEEVFAAAPPVRHEPGARDRIRAAHAAAGRRIAALDDDPTGSQTVHDVSVVTVFEDAEYAAGLAEPGSTCFVLTNTRSLAVTKVSSGQMLVWAARRDNSAAVADASVMWTDGTGVLQSGRTAQDGVLSMERGSPEHTYVIGEDRNGGVFVSENFYYDSEIYNTKIFAVTDRPLYRPGDEVNVKFLGREFKAARLSQAATAAPVGLTVFDPNGTPLLTQTLQLSGETGAETRFRLPQQATACGYELRFSYKDGLYGAAFRVAEYIKPHFEINIQPSKPEFKTGEKVTGTISLRYPDGKPVRNADLSLSLRGQQNTMVEGELRYSGLFPVQLKTEQAETDRGGDYSFTLPPAADPSRYVLTVMATDGAAYRVKATRELMIERSLSSYQLKAARSFSEPGQQVHFDLVADGQGSARPVRWEMVQLEKQEKTDGKFDPAAKGWDVSFARAGSYQLSLRDERGNLLAAASHWVTPRLGKAGPRTCPLHADAPAVRTARPAHREPTDYGVVVDSVNVSVLE